MDTGGPWSPPGQVVYSERTKFPLSVRGRAMAADLEQIRSMGRAGPKPIAPGGAPDRRAWHHVHRCQFVSVTGRVMGKGIPASHWSDVGQQGIPARVRGDGKPVRGPTRPLHPGYEARSCRAGGAPRRTTCFCVLPWDPQGGPGRSAPCSGAERSAEDPGGFLSSDCRGNLHRIHEQFTVRDRACTLQVGCEPAVMWLKTNPDGTPSVDGMTKPYCYHIDQFSELQPIIHKGHRRVLHDPGPGHDPG